MNKRIAIAVTAFVLIFALIGCGKKPEQPKTETAEVTETVEAVVEETEVYVPGTAKNTLSEEDFDDLAVEETQPHETESTEVKDPESEEDENRVESTVPSVPDEESVQDATESTTPAAAELTEYEKYHALSGAEQKAFVDSFASMEAFFEWYNAARAEYEDQDAVIPEDGVIKLN